MPKPSVNPAALSPDDLARASTLTYRGDLARATGDLATSETLLREALDIYRQALPATSPTLGLAQTELAWTLALSSEPARCQPLLDAARPLLDHQDAPPQHRARLLLAAGFYEAAQGQTKQAQADFQAAIDLLDPTLGPQNYWARVAETEQARLRR